jgi:RNA polymerase sigma factor (sigma-70 family)
MDDALLLARFAGSRSEADFRALVDRHVDAVHSACLRRLGGRAADAEEACQAVFVLLAREAPRLRLRSGAGLSGWLLTVARHVSLNRLRATTRRSHHEREAVAMRQAPRADRPWEEARGVLDELVDRLPGAQREAIQLHYLCGKTQREAALALGVGESTVQMRVKAGLERLRALFRGRGLLFTAPVLAACLAERTLSAAPAGLAGSSCASACGAAGASAPVLSLASGAVKAMALAKAKATALLSAACAAPVLAGGIVWTLAAAPAPAPPPASRPVPAAAVAASPADNDAEWRRRTGADPGRGPAAAAPGLDPASVPGLALWLDAAKGVTADTAGKVSAWADQGGPGQDLAQTDATWRPLRLDAALGGKPVVRFAGDTHAAQALVRDGFALPEGRGATVIALLRQSRESTYACLLHYGPDNGKRGVHVNLNAIAAGVGPEKDFSGTVGSSCELPGTGFRIVAVVADGASGRQELYADGARVGAASHPFALDAKGRLVVGGHRPGAGNCHSGCNADLAELMIFHRAVTADERLGLERHLRSKWGLASLSGAVSTLAGRLPFAYYPTTRDVELAFDTEAELLQEHLGGLHRPPDAAGASAGATGLAWAAWGGDKLPGDWAKAGPPAQTGSVADLDLPGPGFDPKPNAPFAVAGWIDVPAEGTYTFVLRPQSAAVLQVAGKIVADQSGSKGTWGTWNWVGGAVALKAGRHRIRIHGLAQPRRIEHEKQPLVLWSGPGFWRQPVPSARLRRAEAEAFVPAAAEAAPLRPLPKALGKPAEAAVRVVDSRTGRVVATGILKLDGSGRGQGRIPVGDLPEGEYAVEHAIGGAAVRLPQTFRREKFPWEGNDLGKGHEVFPPFEPLKADGASVQVVGRSYRVNALGMLDSVQSQGRELLAGPMTVVARAGGKDLALRPGPVSGRVLFPDLAEFTGGASCEAFAIASKTQVEEDGCCRVEWTLTPGPKPAALEWLELLIPLKEGEAPLFGWSAQDSMRHHYWGAVPPAGEILWDTEPGKAPGWVPAAWTKGAGPAPADGRVWDSTRNLHWTQGNRDPFVCYVWMGSEERGLAWWADRPGQFAHDGASPIQLVCREPGRVVLRVRVIQQPTLIEKPRRLVFGLQASPTKPRRPDWRTHAVPGGGGLAVVCWGGYYCSSKYPDNRDFAVVDQILRMALESREGLEDEIRRKLREQDAKRLWKDLKVFDSDEWVTAQTWFLNPARGKSCAAYVEEHAHQVRMPEWQVFQDEWSALPFNRFQGQEGNWGVIAPSYHDFVAYYQNEYMRRGVSLYYDNSFPRQERNPYVLDGEADCAAGLWGLRGYYKRTWKQLQRLERGKTPPPLPLDFTIHATNCLLLPMHTWCTNILDLEQAYRKGRPFPPDYTRAMTSGRQAGVIAHGMFPLANYCDYRDAARKTWTEEQTLADWAMFQVHEVRCGGTPDWDRTWKVWRSFRDAMARAGYDDPKAKVINYWKPEAPVAVQGGADVTWMGVVPPPGGAAPKGVQGIVLLQSYAEGGAKATVTWAGAKALVDHRTRKPVGAGGRAEVELPGRYGTALLWAVDDPGAVPGP